MINLNEPTIGEVWSDDELGNRHCVRWTEWGDISNPNVLFCAHGLSRNSRDFDYLARVLQSEYRIICPDYPGRGMSDWLIKPVSYNNDQYTRDSLAILNTLKFSQLYWIGTSMGGLIGMNIAAMKDNPINKMVINDVGPFIPYEALSLISTYLGLHPRFSSLSEAKEYFRTVYAGFGKLEEQHYDHFVKHGVSRQSDGDGYTLNYDPEVIDQFTAAVSGDIDLWETWDEIDIPILVVRGKLSGLLLSSTLELMKSRSSTTDSVEFDDCAHAPSLMVEEQIAVIANWLHPTG